LIQTFGNLLDLYIEEWAAPNAGVMPRPSVITVLRERGLRGLLSAVLRRVRRPQNPSTFSSIHIENLSRVAPGIDVVGFFTSEHGVGEAARTLVNTLRFEKINVSTINYEDTESRTEHLFVTDEVSRYHSLLLSLNADQLVVAKNRFSPEFFENRYIIGQWFWELETAPSWYEEAWPIVDELWAPTRFIETMLKSSAPSHVTIRHIPLPIKAPRIDVSLTRPKLNLDGRYMFLFVFDLMSIMKRKNPLGLISAYTKAFGQSDGAQLVIKTMNGDKRSEDLRKLMEASSSRSDIVVIDEVFSGIETSSLIALSDCYVSLHRSEGLGLTLSEAMSLGKPVIATNYSGNTDFMTEQNSYLLPWARVPVGDDAGGYDPTSTWAEPDEESAISALRHVYKNQQEARFRGACGQEDVLGGHSEATSGAIMKRRLEEIWKSTNGH
jgi:glycosyltransferase involved in cell wall biosynthesis